MTAAYELARLCVDFVTMLKPGDYEWQERKLRQISEIKKLKKTLDLEMTHDLDMLRIRFEEELTREKENQIRITRDYKEFLDSLDEMKNTIKDTFKRIPPPMVYVIHNHARDLLDGSWHNSDSKAREICKSRLADFMLVVFEDAEQAMLESSEEEFPTKTLSLIKGGRIQETEV